MGVNVAAAVDLVQKWIPIRSGRRPRVAQRSPHSIARLLAILSLTIAAGCVLSSCGGGSGATTVSSVTISPTSITVPLNTQTTFTAVVNLANSTVSTTTTVTWEVNGIAGGDLGTVGSILASPDNELEGIYTGPSSVPSQTISGVTQVGQVAITAVTTQTTTSKGQSTTGTVTSNTAIVTVGSGAGLTVSPTTPTVPAGATQQFTALLNGLTDTNATWTVTPSSPASTYGSIGSSGLYTAPLNPPPGGTVTVTATDPAAPQPATSTVTISYSDHSLSGPYAFSYTGNDSQGFLAVAGSFVADGNGRMVSGVEDVSSFLTGVKTVQINSGSSTYVIGADGRGTANIVTNLGQSTWDFAMTTTGHAQITRMDAAANGGGTIDEQSLAALSNNLSVVTGPYVFNLLGADASFSPLGLAGKFTANGSGMIPASASIIDVNDDGIASAAGIKTSDTSLSGSYEFDPVFTGTGRGLLTLTSNSTGASAREYAFYAVNSPESGDTDSVVRLHLVEIDSLAFVAGDMYAAPSGATALTAGTYVFTGGGQVPAGAYAAGGAFVSSGSGGITGGNFDANSDGTYNNGPAINACSSYTTDNTTGRIDLKMYTGSGACPATPNSSTNEYAVYQTSQGTALVLEIDQNALSTGTAYQQCVPPAAACSASVSLLGGSFAIGLVGQGIFHNDSSAYQPDFSGQLTIGSGVSITSGTLDINSFGTPSASDPVSASAIAAPTSNGRGTATLTTTNPSSTFKLVYYLIDDNTALIFDQDTTPIATGTVARQF